jgi:hypothetical protein
MRNIKFVNHREELELIDTLGDKLLEVGFNSSNSVIITVSTDYSSIVGQILRHQLTYDGEICDVFGVDVPYPDEVWNKKYVDELSKVFQTYGYLLERKTAILVEAGVISGGNYEFLTMWMKKYLGIGVPIVTISMYENVGSRFKSDFVAEYYDDTTQDLTFWWEMGNKHWK